MMRPILLLTLAGAICGSLFDTGAQAATIGAQNAARVLDVNGDDVGDSGFNASRGAAVGEPGSNNEDNEGRMVFYFDPDAAQRAAIAAATQVTFDVFLERDTGTTNLSGFHVDLYGLTNTTASSVDKTHYDAAGNLLSDQAFTPTSPSGQFQSFDITSFAKTEAARSANATIVLRLQVDPATLPIANGTNTYWVFQGPGVDVPEAERPTLTITTAVPTPAALPAGLMLLVSLGMRRPPR